MGFSQNQPEWKRELAAKRAALRRAGEDEPAKRAAVQRTGEDETDKPVTRSETAMLEHNDDSSGRKV